MRLKRISAFLIVIILSYNCMAWGPEGHKLVAKIAYSQLTAAVKDSLALYLRGASIAEAANWMDEIRSDKSYDFQKPWHYVNIDKGVTYNPDDTGNIVWELKRIIPELKERQKYSKERIEIDIKILIHLVGDLHQPLHVGYAYDQGGNMVQVFCAASPSNLHRVWDTEIIRDGVMGHSVEWTKLSQFSKEELAQIKHVDIIEWMNESRSKLDIVYDFKGNDITQKYIEKNTPVVERQLLIGGLRLGILLNDIFRSKENTQSHF
jgi:hypothetical protein